jgi:hypothetical protein
LSWAIPTWWKKFKKTITNNGNIPLFGRLLVEKGKAMPDENNPVEFFMGK